MRYISIFSGIEAATVAWEPLGWEPVAFCEIDAFPSAVLANRFPNVPNLGDICKVDWREVIDGYGSVDVVIGGSPCQSFSTAGKRESLDGESRLMFEYIRAVYGIRPRWLIWENVPGVFSVKDDAFGQLLHELENLGYGLAWRVLDAQFFGVAQRRRRVFLIGHAGGMVGAAAAVLFERESVSGNTQSSRAKRESLARAAGFGASCSGFKFHQGAGAGSIGYEAEQSPTITADWHNPAVLAFNDGQITSKENGSNPQFGDPCHTLAAKDHVPCIAIQGDGSTSKNCHGDGYQTDGSSYTLNCTDRHSVMCMATAQANAEILHDVSPTVVAGQEHPIVCMADDTGNAAVDTDLCGTLLAGGGAPLIASVQSAQGITRASGTSTSKRGN